MSLPLLPLLVSRVPPGLRLALQQEGVPVVECKQPDAAGRFVLFDSRSGPQPELAAGQEPIDIDLIRQQEGRDLLADLTDERPARQAWRIGWLDAVEEVARRDKRAARRRVIGLLRQEVERLGQTAGAQFRARYRQNMLTLLELSATLFGYDTNLPEGKK